MQETEGTTVRMDWRGKSERENQELFFMPLSSIPICMWGSSEKLSSSAEAAPFSASSVQWDFQSGYNFQIFHWLAEACSVN